jgi:hypothetical protein
MVGRFSHDSDARIDASIPHPFFDNQPRDVAGTMSGVSRTETGVHLQVTYTPELRGRLQLTFSAGPSHMRVEQDLITGVLYSESFPYDEATFSRGDTDGASGSALGFNGGVDVKWMLGRRHRFGLGGMLRYTRVSLDLDWPAGGRSIPVKAGGLQGGAGIRLQF